MVGWVVAKRRGADESIRSDVFSCQGSDKSSSRIAKTLDRSGSEGSRLANSLSCAVDRQKKQEYHGAKAFDRGKD